MSLTAWCPAADTSVSVNGSTVIISSTGTVYSYETMIGTGRGFAPMYYGQVESGQFSVSASISLSIQYKADCNVYAGFMILTSTLVPMCEFGIGGNNLGSLDPIVVKPYCSIPTYQGNGSIGKISVTGDGSQIQFNDGTRAMSVVLTKPPGYVALYLRGLGKNSATFTNLSISGLSRTNVPSYTPFALEIPGAYYYGMGVYNTSKIMNVNNGKVICISDSTASAFSYDTSTNECRLIQDLEITNVKASGTSTLYIQNMPVVSDVFVAKDFSPVQANNINIEVIAIDNTNGSRDAVVITPSNLYISTNFSFTPVRASGDDTATLCIRIPVNNSNIYVYSLNNYDYKRIGIIDNNFNKVGGTFINQHFKFDKSKGGTWYLANSNSYTRFSNVATYPQYYFNYGAGKFQFHDERPSKGTSDISTIVGASDCKIVATSGTRFMCLNQNIFILLNGSTSYWANDNIKGALFFNKTGYPIQLISGAPVPSPTPFELNRVCLGTVTDIHIKYDVPYDNSDNSHTCIFRANGTYNFRGNEGTYNKTSYQLVSIPGRDCIAEIQLIGSKPTNVVTMYANSSDERLTDDDYSEYPIFVKYQPPPDPETGTIFEPVIIEFVPHTIPNNYIQ